MTKYLRFRTPLKNSLFAHRCRDMMNNKYDVQIIIRAKNAKRGPGKTTLALKLAKILDPTWTSERGVLDLIDYYKLYEDPKTQGHTIVYDEIGITGDNRKSTSKENRSLSHSWMELRSRNINTIGTLPTTTTLDKRLIELADFDVIVTQRGQAIVLESDQNIYTGNLWKYPVGSHMHEYVRRTLARLAQHNYYIPDDKTALEVLHWQSLDDTDDFEEMGKKKDISSSRWLQSEIKRMEDGK